MKNILHKIGMIGVALVGLSHAAQGILDNLAPAVSAAYPKAVPAITAIGGLVAFVGYVGHLAASEDAPVVPPIDPTKPAGA